MAIDAIHSAHRAGSAEPDLLVLLGHRCAEQGDQRVLEDDVDHVVENRMNERSPTIPSPKSTLPTARSPMGRNEAITATW